MVLQFTANHIYLYRGLVLAFEMETRCDRVDAVEDPSTTVLQLIELAGKCREIDSRQRFSRNKLDPAFIPVLKLDMLALDQEDPCAVSTIVDG